MQLVLELFLELKVLLEAVVVVVSALLAWLILQLGGEGSETRRGCCYPRLIPILL